MEEFYSESADSMSLDASDYVDGGEAAFEAQEDQFDVMAEDASAALSDVDTDIAVEALDAAEEPMDVDLESIDEEIDVETEQDCIDGLTDDEIAAAMLDEDISDAPPAFSQAMNDPELFNENEAGDYTYLENESGKKAFGSLEHTDDPQRDPVAQRTVGGEDRHPDDDGGHLIGARFDSNGGYENLDAQNSNLNRGSYKQMENGWAKSLEDGDKVFVDVETYKSENNDRPDAYMGYSITEHADGNREWDAFSFQNESRERQEAWAREVEEASPELNDDIPNAMAGEGYDDIREAAHEDIEDWF